MEALSRLALGLFCALPVAAQAGDEPPPSAAELLGRAQAAAEGSPERLAAVRSALQTLDAPLEGASLRLVWQTGVDAARALELEDAIAIQSWLAARHPADWSAMDLALSLGMAGETARADAVLADAIARARTAGEPTAELWSRRGILWLGAGDERRGRDGLGHALALGSADASIVLALLDLHQGRPAKARAGFRAGLYDDPPGAWALRGWGLSLLPADPARPVRPLQSEDSYR